MKLTILGSGGFRRTPRPGCHCAVCREMRENNAQRLGTALFVHDGNILFDAPEEIAADLESAGIHRMDNLFFTHWHPDHTMGARILEIMNTQWAEELEWRMKAVHKTDVHMPNQVHDEIMSRFGPFFEFWKSLGIADVHHMEGPVQIGEVRVEAITFETRHRTMTHSTAYIISSGCRKVVYAPCDITPFPQDERFKGCDLMILQVGWYGEEMAERARNGPHYEISMDEILDIARLYGPRRIVLTHIGDESGLLQADISAIEDRYRNFHIQFAHDLMTLDV